MTIPQTDTSSRRERPSENGLTIRASRSGRAVSPTLFGLFFEDINFSADGGLNANLVNNHSFEGVYLERGTGSIAEGIPTLTPAGRLVDPTRHWHIVGGTLTSQARDGDGEEGLFGRVDTAGEARLRNPGYPGVRNSMWLSGRYFFEALVRTDAFTGTVLVQLVSDQDSVLATQEITLDRAGWQSVRLELAAGHASFGELELVFSGGGTVDIDEVRLVPEDHWGAGDPRWSQGLLRRDLVEILRDMRPRFLRFPGGCIIEGCGDGSHYKWKDTVGPIAQRRAEFNLWGQLRQDGDYSQSNQIGFYEYFLLCEDLGIEPLPIAWAGLSCQFRSDECVPLDSPEFEEVVQDALDLIDWATGDPAESTWAALRVEAGHPEPFALNYFGIGNENFGPEYIARFDRIKAAVDQRRPGMNIVMSSGALHEGEGFDQTWARARPHTELIVDEHFYQPAEWFIASTTRYDDYPRGGARVFIGEYAAHSPQLAIDPEIVAAAQAPGHESAGPGAAVQPNSWLSGLAEAAFLTGVERNADVIAMTSYAPLFHLVGHGQWAHNLIDFSPRHVMPTVNYLVQQAFAAHLGETISVIEGSAPEGVFTSATATQGVVYIKLVNVSDATVHLPVHIPDAQGGPVQGIEIGAELAEANRLSFRGDPEIAVSPRERKVLVEDARISIELAPRSLLVIPVPLARD